MRLALTKTHGDGDVFDPEFVHGHSLGRFKNADYGHGTTWSDAVQSTFKRRFKPLGFNGYIRNPRPSVKSLMAWGTSTLLGFSPYLPSRSFGRNSKRESSMSYRNDVGGPQKPCGCHGAHANRA